MPSYSYKLVTPEALFTYDWSKATVEAGYVDIVDSMLHEFFGDTRVAKQAHSMGHDWWAKLFEIQRHQEEKYAFLRAPISADTLHVDVGDAVQAMHDAHNEFEGLMFDAGFTCGSYADSGIWYFEGLYPVWDEDREDWLLVPRGDHWSLLDSQGGGIESWGFDMRSLGAAVVEVMTGTMEGEGYYPNLYVDVSGRDDTLCYSMVVDFQADER